VGIADLDRAGMVGDIHLIRSPRLVERLLRAESDRVTPGFVEKKFINTFVKIRIALPWCSS
jgi:hypothetical protein